MSEKNVMEKENCGCCRFFHWDEQLQKFECRRNAPRWNSGSGMGCTDNLWPEITANQWCGEWKKSDEWIYA